jgi:hypothetical protein
MSDPFTWSPLLGARNVEFVDPSKVRPWGAFVVHDSSEMEALGWFSTRKEAKARTGLVSPFVTTAVVRVNRWARP